MKKRLNIIVDYTCENCPYYYFDYHDSYALSGHFCMHNKSFSDGKIADEGATDHYVGKMKKWQDSQKTLLPMSEDEKPVDPLLIPEWCPLPDAE